MNVPCPACGLLYGHTPRCRVRLGYPPKRMLIMLIPIIIIILVGIPSPAEANTSCSAWDVEETCCPAACAVSKGANWPRANQVLRSCMESLGCSAGDVQGATVYSKCECR